MRHSKSNKTVLQKPKIRKKAAFRIAGLLSSVCHALGSGGTSLPGLAAGWIYPDLLPELAEGIPVMLVTGTNGKTTTVHMTAEMLKYLQVPHICTRFGGNVTSSILTTFLGAYRFRREKPSAVIAVIECDEKFFPEILKKLKPFCVTITNISKDQTDRLGQPEDVAAMFSEALKEYDGKICIDASDPYAGQAVSGTDPEKIIRFDCKGNEISVNRDHYHVELNIPGKYNVKNAAAAVASLCAAGFSAEEGIPALAAIQPLFARMETFCIGTTTVHMNLSKNAEGVKEYLNYINEETNGPVCAVFGFNDLPEDGRDMSWLGDVPWDTYRHCFSKVIVYVDCCDAAEKYLLRAGLEPVTVYSADRLIKEITECDVPVCLVFNYTCMMRFRKKLAKKKYVQAFWKGHA